MRENTSNVTPTLADTIYTLIDSVMVDVNVCMPGKVVKYDKSTQKADVQPQIMTKLETGKVDSLPVIPNVPVVHPSSGKAFIHLPIKVGDDVMIVFAQRSLDNWKTQGGLSNPADRRKFNLSDAVAYPGGRAFPDAFKPETDNAIEIVNDQASIQVLPTGKFKIKNATNELLDQLQQGFSTLAGASTIAGGPFVPTVVAALNNIASAIGSLKG